MINVGQEHINMAEGYMEKKFEKQATQYGKRYADILTEAENTFNEQYSKNGRSWNVYDTVALGQYLNNWEEFMEYTMNESDPTSRDSLGDYMKVGLGLAAIQYLAMPAAFLASIQPMQDEVGMIYFRELVATVTRGNITAGDIIGSQGGKLSNDLDGYYSERLTSTTALSVGGTPYNVTLSKPVRARTVKVTITKTTGGSTTTYSGLDDGEGSIIGNWPTPLDANTGTINYETGAVVINVKCDEGDVTGNIVIDYHQNLAHWAHSEVIYYC